MPCLVLPPALPVANPFLPTAGGSFASFRLVSLSASSRSLSVCKLATRKTKSKNALCVGICHYLPSCLQLHIIAVIVTRVVKARALTFCPFWFTCPPSFSAFSCASPAGQHMPECPRLPL